MAALVSKLNPRSEDSKANAAAMIPRGPPASTARS